MHYLTTYIFLKQSFILWIIVVNKVVILMKYCYKGKQTPNIITLEELKKIVRFIMDEKDSCSDLAYSKYCKAKWILMIYLIYFLGLRPNEARLIEINHIDFKKKVLYIPSKNVKTHDDDIVPIPYFIYPALWNFLKIRCNHFHNNKYLFSAKGRRGFSDRNYLGKKFNEILSRLQISRVVYNDIAGKKRMSKNLYSCRHSFGTRVYQSTDGNVKKVATALRHHDSNYRSAMVYVRMSENESREKVFEELYPSSESLN